MIPEHNVLRANPETVSTLESLLTSACLSPVQSIEDPFDQDDWENWAKFTASTDIQVRHRQAAVGEVICYNNRYI